ncbi:dynein regulatory complex subunit 6 [Periophthalmus magnuspinnatus]|uniref:dynein regulatory complex subunit 6 n=1 Tax=Periophthalmus magnuspinnatus TaxID=409849 RepID=UPI002436D859|nr:dynein regulatory complex subunit 6 [Periophthalmus magnuspinnatus]
MGSKPWCDTDVVSKLPSCLSLKIFQFLCIRDWLSCAEVCSSWRDLIQSSALWSQINFSSEKEWFTNAEVKQILQMYRPFVVHLNLRGCTFLTWPSIKCVSECRNLQELNLSECSNITDVMVQKLTKGCPGLLYLNLSATNITNQALRELSRNCLNLQYLSVAYCCRFTDQGFLYLTTGRGCHTLVHLNVSGCTQMTVNAFRYISAGCPALKQIVINDMPTLSDSCVMALLSRCHCLSVISLLDAPNLSDLAFKAIAEVAKLRSLYIEGNNQLTDVSWKALCTSSLGLRKLHAAECTRLNNTSVKYMGTLKHLQYLDISMCNVGNIGIKHLTDSLSAPKLRELNISYCSQITDTAVRRIALRLNRLYHLNLSYCGGLSDKSLEFLSDSSICSLDISGCSVQDQGLASLERVHLRKIVLAECIFVTDVGIENLCRNVKYLEDVDISYCAALTDRAIRTLSFYCRGLITLKMAACVKMTDMGIHYLTTGTPYLRQLDVSGCIHLTDRTVRHLERICPPLCSVSMAYCRGISKLAALRLKSYMDHWEHNNDEPCDWLVVKGLSSMVTPVKTEGTGEEKESIRRGRAAST